MVASAQQTYQLEFRSHRATSSKSRRSQKQLVTGSVRAHRRTKCKIRKRSVHTALTVQTCGQLTTWVQIKTQNVRLLHGHPIFQSFSHISDVLLPFLLCYSNIPPMFPLCSFILFYFFLFSPILFLFSHFFHFANLFLFLSYFL